MWGGFERGVTSRSVRGGCQAGRRGEVRPGGDLSYRFPKGADNRPGLFFGRTDEPKMNQGSRRAVADWLGTGGGAVGPRGAGCSSFLAADQWTVGLLSPQTFMQSRAGTKTPFLDISSEAQAKHQTTIRPGCRIAVSGSAAVWLHEL